jgi:hypothetical protein
MAAVVERAVGLAVEAATEAATAEEASLEEVGVTAASVALAQVAQRQGEKPAHPGHRGGTNET